MMICLATKKLLHSKTHRLVDTYMNPTAECLSFSFFGDRKQSAALF